MPQYDTDYFEKLLSATRKECETYTLHCQKRLKNTLLCKFPPHHNKVNQATKRIQKLQKQEAPEEEIKAAQCEYDKVLQDKNEFEAEILDTLGPILDDAATNIGGQSHDLHLNLMKFAILNQAGPENLAQFCQEYGNTYIEELLGNEDVMKEMLLNGGANNGKYGQAYKIFQELMELMERNHSEYDACHRRLAMSIALVHAEPKYVFDSRRGGAKGVIIDPIKRFLHYVEAHKNGELDPAFPFFSTWEYRFVVASQASDEELKWGRDHIKRYRPDLPNAKYLGEVWDDIRYRPMKGWTVQPNTFCNLLSDGGKCGPRAWYGEYIVQAFGVPCKEIYQPGHAAIARWSPKCCWIFGLGSGGVDTCKMDGPHGRHWEYHLLEAQTRSVMRNDYDTYFRKVTLLECMAEVHGEEEKESFRFKAKFFWGSLVNAQKILWAKKATPEDYKRAPTDNDKVEFNLIEEHKARTDTPRQDNKAMVLEDGVIRIPICAFSRQVKCSPMLSFGGGAQVYMRDEGSELHFTIDNSVPEGDYDLICRVCNVHRHHEKQQLCFKIGNGAEEKVASIPYTAGEWKYTKPVQFHLGAKDSLKISRCVGEGDLVFGLTIKEMMLRPSGSEDWVLVGLETS